MKVAKKVRFLQKDKNGKFINNENFAVLRHRAVVQESVVDETVDNYEDTGVLYIIDKEATEEFNNPKTSKEPSEKDVLKEEYKALSGEDAKGTWGVKKLTEEINAIQNA
jgi:hypothetical protein|tara:strand:+ start:1982 stop:2308 length:327 start_codon:yes stop_codon:yes gene_type:complete